MSKKYRINPIRREIVPQKPVLRTKGTSFIITSLTIPPPTAVINERDKTPVKLKLFSIAMMDPVILKEISPIESLSKKSGLFSMEFRL